MFGDAAFGNLIFECQHMIASIVLSIITFASLQTETDADPQQVLRVVDALHKPLKSCYLEYEGELIADSPEDRRALGIDTGINMLYSGIFKYSQSDKYINTIFKDRLSSKIQPDRALRRLTILCDGQETHIFGKADGAVGAAVTRHVTSADFDETGSWGKVWLVRRFRELLKYEKKRLIYTGTESIDGARCEHYAFVLGRPPYHIDAPNSLVYQFWIDMNRSAQVFRCERWNDGRLLERTVDVVLEQFGAKNESVWLPVRGTIEHFDGEGNLHSTEKYRLLKDTIAINKGIGDSQFTIKYPIGTPVSDRIRGLAYEVGQDRRPPPETLAEAEARLKDSLKKAEESRSELVAFSWSRGEFINWAFWLPLAVCLVSAVGAGFVYLRRAS